MDRTVRITAEEYGTWWANYDLSGLVPGQKPPKSLINIAKECDLVLSSSLPRAIETAQKVVEGKRAVPQDPIFVEAPLPPPPVPYLRLTPTRWGQISRTFWFLGYAPENTENHVESWRRVRQVTDRLIGHAMTGGDVLLCAHGYLNWMIDHHITKRGWDKVGHEGGNHYWSWRVYRMAAPEAKPVRQTTATERS